MNYREDYEEREIFNRAPFEYSPAHVGGMFDDRCMRGLITSKIMASKDFTDLVSTYDEAIKQTMNQKSIADYEKVRDFLMYNEV